MHGMEMGEEYDDEEEEEYEVLNRNNVIQGAAKPAIPRPPLTR
jgi:hypothetical protein